MKKYMLLLLLLFTLHLNHGVNSEDLYAHAAEFNLSTRPRNAENVYTLTINGTGGRHGKGLIPLDSTNPSRGKHEYPEGTAVTFEILYLPWDELGNLKSNADVYIDGVKTAVFEHFYSTTVMMDSDHEIFIDSYYLVRLHLRVRLGSGVITIDPSKPEAHYLGESVVWVRAFQPVTCVAIPDEGYLFTYFLKYWKLEAQSVDPEAGEAWREYDNPLVTEFILYETWMYLEAVFIPSPSVIPEVPGSLFLQRL